MLRAPGETGMEWSMIVSQRVMMNNSTLDFSKFAPHMLPFSTVFATPQERNPYSDCGQNHG